MSRTVQFPNEEARSSETFERTIPLNLNFNNPEDFIPIPTIYASRAVMDVYIEKVVDKMKEVREEFSVTAAKGLTDSDHVCTVIQAAQVVVDAMVLSVRRHYHQREEGLRTRREREYAAISRAGCFSRIKRTFVTISYSMDIHALIMKMEEEKRTTILLDAFKKLRLHSQIATLTDGGSEPHWNWSLS
ncbi:hypothetical protein HG530_002630 [Fusarium avenaceum]|nr:hypothetical protein DER45DRAFT_539850 [Fusarium avenaceum]KAI6775872.1 hypothetical protein HG530_002630 [Fusarium avenaceum]